MNPKDALGPSQVASHPVPNGQRVQADISARGGLFPNPLPSGNQKWLAGESPINIYQWRFLAGKIEVNGGFSSKTCLCVTLGFIV
jgi:hypothetical protein